MPFAVILERPGEIDYREVRESDVYKPTPEEEIAHGTKVVTRQLGDPGPDEVETRAILGAVCTHEVSLYLGDLTHPRYPMIPGHEAVHVVTRVGKNVRHLKEGDYAACCWYMGQWSEKVIGPAATAYKLPDRIDDPANWVIEPAASVVNALCYMDIKPGAKVLLIGAGFMGLLITQLLHGYPLQEFVAADLKPFNLQKARECGAYEVIRPLEDGSLEGYEPGHFDAVIECTGSQSGLDTAVRMAGMAGGIYLFGWHRKPRVLDFRLGHLRGQRLIHTSPAIDEGRAYERYWPTTIRLFERGAFDLSKLMTHKYRAGDIKRCMEDSVARKDGFLKSAFYLQ